MANYENIFNLQNKHKLSFKEAKEADKLGYIAGSEHMAEYFVILEKREQDEIAKQEHLADLEERGFYFGTDCPMINEQIERGEAFQDKYDMYRNEY
ncbi:hypothetical protein [Photobacterium leiognathi]|uniref:hypothetical protein n=1 Tax=Photobacterium leiognathi TaxID=553611 RepID=UPI0029819A1F|nr:hypothetical protein [Photobacterium leiognathi]